MRRLFPSRAFWLALVSFVTLAGGLVPASAQALTACEATKPIIEDVRLTGITLAGVGIEAQIDPEGTETAYEFLVVWRALNPTERGEPLPGGPRPHGGRIPAGAGNVTVSAVVSGLQPGYTYWYEVVASNLAGKTKYGGGPFSYFYEGGYPNGTGSGPPYTTEESPCAIESGNEAAARTLQEYRIEHTWARSLSAHRAFESAISSTRGRPSR